MFLFVIAAQFLDHDMRPVVISRRRFIERVLLDRRGHAVMSAHPVHAHDVAFAAHVHGVGDAEEEIDFGIDLERFVGREEDAEAAEVVRLAAGVSELDRQRQREAFGAAAVVRHYATSGSATTAGPATFISAQYTMRATPK